jgi:hypothetical protein
MPSASVGGLLTATDAPLACATATAEGFLGCEDAPTFCGGTSGGISCSDGVASVEAGISAVFDGKLELGAEWAILSEVTSVKISRQGFNVVYIVF